MYAIIYLAKSHPWHGTLQTFKYVQTFKHVGVLLPASLAQHTDQWSNLPGYADDRHAADRLSRPSLPPGGRISSSPGSIEWLFGFPPATHTPQIPIGSEPLTDVQTLMMLCKI